MGGGLLIELMRLDAARMMFRAAAINGALAPPLILLVLLLSSYTLSRALRAVRQDDRRHLVAWLARTALLGALFLTVQGAEWIRLVGFGLTASSGVYGGSFYTLIGAHGVHVLAALVWLTVVTLAAARGRYVARDHVGVAVCAMYWHFVVALWPVLYVLVYLA